MSCVLFWSQCPYIGCCSYVCRGCHGHLPKDDYVVATLFIYDSSHRHSAGHHAQTSDAGCPSLISYFNQMYTAHGRVSVSELIALSIDKKRAAVRADPWHPVSHQKLKRKSAFQQANMEAWVLDLMVQLTRCHASVKITSQRQAVCCVACCSPQRCSMSDGSSSRMTSRNNDHDIRLYNDSNWCRTVKNMRRLIYEMEYMAFVRLPGISGWCLERVCCLRPVVYYDCAARLLSKCLHAAHVVLQRHGLKWRQSR